VKTLVIVNGTVMVLGLIGLAIGTIVYLGILEYQNRRWRKAEAEADLPL
jgi:hypothetical protein